MSYNPKAISSWTPSKNMLGPPLQFVYDGEIEGDSIATIESSGYFNQLKNEMRLRLNDLIYVIGTDGKKFYYVNSVSPNVTISTFGPIINNADIPDGSVTTVKFADDSIIGNKVSTTASQIPNSFIPEAYVFEVAPGGGFQDIIISDRVTLFDIYFIMMGDGTPLDSVVLRNKTSAANITTQLYISSYLNNQHFTYNTLSTPLSWVINAGNTISLIVTDGGDGNAPGVFCVALGFGTA